MNSQQRTELIGAAADMRKFAYCPYSNYRVGAAVLCDTGRIYTGCNVENASYSATVCAERTAALKAVSEGQTHFIAMAIAVSGQAFGYPCGVCLQFLSEFARDMPLILINAAGQTKETALKNLFARAFQKEDMK